MKKLNLCIMAILLIMLSTSCVSTKTVTVVPEITFPIFPVADEMRNNGDGTVTVDSEWIVRLAEYSIRIQETEENYKEIKKIYEDKN